jgi:hypothetical protein
MVLNPEAPKRMSKRKSKIRKRIKSKIKSKMHGSEGAIWRRCNASHSGHTSPRID